MRFDEPDTRDAYREGARDVFESVSSRLSKQKAAEFKAWLADLENWDAFDPPPPPAPEYS